VNPSHRDRTRITAGSEAACQTRPHGYHTVKSGLEPNRVCHYPLPQNRGSLHSSGLFNENVNLLPGHIHPRVSISMFWRMVDLFPAQVHDICMKGSRFELIAACLVAEIAAEL